MSPRSSEKGVRDKTAERHISLVMLLQSSRFGFTKQQIYQRVPGYTADNPEAADRMFERDKVELLAAGFDIEAIQDDPVDANSFVYRINSGRALLPDVNLSPSEQRVLNLATLAWQSSENAEDALWLRHKLETLGLDTEVSEPVVDFGRMRDVREAVVAVMDRRVIKFDYRKPQQINAEARTLEPYGLVVREGQWYIYGRDRDRQALRIFNLARVTSEFKVSGAANAFEPDTSIDAKSLLSVESLRDSGVTVRLRIDAGRGLFWRQRSSDPHALEMAAGTFEVQLRAPATMIPRLAGDAPGVIVEYPEDVRAAVKSLLEASR